MWDARKRGRSRPGQRTRETKLILPSLAALILYIVTEYQRSSLLSLSLSPSLFIYNFTDDIVFFSIVTTSALLP